MTYFQMMYKYAPDMESECIKLAGKKEFRRNKGKKDSQTAILVVKECNI